MKKTLLLFALFLSVCASAMAQVVVSGDITANTSWTKNNTYLLSGFVYVTNGAVLTIEPGTVIKGDKNSKGSLIITRGAQIIANGTPDQPIVFTSAEAAPTYGDWGGLILLGYAPTNNVYNGTPGLGLIEGGVDPVKGIYGGGDQAGGAKADDNSGILRYVRVEYPGIAFQPNNEINGITFGGVGNKTTVDYVQVSYSGDDSFEWFGGTVNCRHLVAYRGLDDDFDTDFGYNGNIQFAISVRDPQVADVSGSNGFEADNNATGTGATPKSRATFSNVTIIGPPTATSNANYKRGGHLRRNTEQGIYNSVIVGVWPDAGLLIDGDSCANNATSGKLLVRNSFLYGSPTPLKTNVAAFDINAWGVGKITASVNSADAKLTDPFNLNLPNARPLSGSPLLGAASFTADARIKDAFFVPVSYAGAFGFNDDWTCPWSKFPTGGCLPSIAPQEVIVSSDITTDTKWTADKTYTLQGFIYVTNCAKLTIEPGTVIKGDKGSKGALIVTRCAQIIADGTKDKPIVFTSAEAAPTYGDWGGLILLGYAPTNNVYNGTPGLGLIEGGVDPVKGIYGGGDQAGGAKADDNSGILRYVRVEYPGIAFQPNNEINGITFGGVGNKTTVDYVQVSYSGDDSFEWFGGTVNCKHLIAYRGLDDDFDADFGYNGDVQFALSVRDPQVADVSGSNGFEIDNNATGTGAKPKTRPTFSNVTLLGPGPGTTINANYRRAAHLRRNSEAAIFNSLLLGNWPDAGILIDGDSCAAHAPAGRLEVRNTLVATPVPLKTNVTSFAIAPWFATVGFANASSTDLAAGKLIDGYNLDLPNAHPAPGSPALLPNAAAFTAARVNKPFFDKVAYIGAFDGTKAGDWTCGWAKFKTLNTACFTDTKDVEKYIAATKLYPTVANDQIMLEIDLVNSADLNVVIYGSYGQHFGQMLTEKAPAGQQSYRLDVSHLTPGIYFVQIQAGAAVKTEKLIVVR
jgi:hypothetical protein